MLRQGHSRRGKKIKQVDALGGELVYPQKQGHHQQQKGAAADAPGGENARKKSDQGGKEKVFHSRYRTPP